MKIALIHDHLAQDGGAEKVLQAFQEIWPEAPTFVLVHNPHNASEAFNNKDIRTSFIQRLPFGVKRYQWYFPLMPTAVESYDLMDYDVVLSSTASFAKGVITKPETLHICYCHTPTRYLWSDTHSYVRELGASRLVKWMLPFFLTNVRVWDKAAADRVDKFIANSKLVQDRIVKYYKSGSDVIYPPVRLDAFSPQAGTDYYLAGGRLVPYKRFDIIVEAFSHLGRKLIIFGDGPEYNSLRSLASSNIEFVGKVSDEQLAQLYKGALGFINPQVEDFGITMVEAMASGTPVIAYRAGGAVEIVEEGVTGEFFDHQTWEDLADAIIHFQPEQYDPHVIRARAEQFSMTKFKTEIKQYVEQAYQEFTAKY